MIDHKPCLAFFQNTWVRDPERLRRMIAAHGEVFRRDIIRRLLFRGCKTGRNLRRYFGDDLIEQMHIEETTRGIAGDSKTILPVDLGHIRESLREHAPRVVLTFGMIARNAIEAVGPMVLGTAHVHCHHPASRHPGTPQNLTLGAELLRNALRTPDTEDVNTSHK